MLRANRLNLDGGVLSRRETEVVPSADNVWALQELAIAYGQETGLKSACKGIKRAGFVRIHYEIVAKPLEWKFPREDLTKLIQRLDQQAKPIAVLAA